MFFFFAILSPVPLLPPSFVSLSSAKPPGVYTAAIASDMVEIAEAFAALGVKDDAALRVLTAVAKS